MFKHITSWLRDIWRKHVTEPLEEQKARAAIKREQTIAESSRVQDRGQTKLITYGVAKEQPSGTPAKDIAPKAAEYLRTLHASGNLPEELERVGKSLPQPTRRQTEPLWKKAGSSAFSKVWNALDWLDTQTGRVYYALTNAIKELGTASKKMEETYKKANVDLTPRTPKSFKELLTRGQDIRTKLDQHPEVAEEATNVAVEGLRRMAKAAEEGLRDPRIAKKRGATTLLPDEFFADWVPKGVREAIRFPTDIAIQTYLDPTSYIDITSRTGVEVLENTLPWLRRLGETEKALAVEDYARKAEQGITRLTETLKQTQTERKAVENTLKTLRKPVKRAEKFINNVDVPMKNVNERIVNLAEQIGKIDRSTRETKAALTKQIQDLTGQRQSILNALDELRSSEVRHTSQGAKQVAKLERQLDRLNKQITREEQTLETVLNKFVQQKQKNIAKLQEAIQKAAGLRQQTAAYSEVLRQYDAATKRLARIQRMQEASEKGIQRLTDVLDKLRARPEYTLKVGPISIPLRPVGEALGDAYRYAISRTPGVREVTNFLTDVFRPGTVKYSPEITVKEARKLTEAKQTVLDWLRRAGSEGVASSKRVLEATTQYKIPSKAWQAAETVEAFLQNREDAVELLKKLPDEVQPYIDDVIKIHKASEEEVRQLLEKAFGPEMIGYFGRGVEDINEGWRFFLQGYLPRILLDPPEKIEKVLPKLSEVLAKSSVGGKPGFTRQRLVETIPQLKALGLHPVEDIRVLDAAHRGQAEMLIQLKHMTDWLEAKGLITKAANAANDWVDISSKFPWLKGYKAHPEIADAIKQMQQIFVFDNRALHTLTKVHKGIMNVFRPLVTVMRPKFFVYNNLGNITLAMQAGMKPDEIIAYATKGAKTLILPETQEEKRLVDLFQRFGLEGQGASYHVIEAPQRFAKQLEQYLERIGSGIGKIKAVVWPVHGSRVPLLDTMSHLNQVSDSAFRMGAFQYFIDKGHTPWEAAQLVKRYFFDYSSLSAFERNVLRDWFIPFYSWMRYAIPRAILGPIEHPYYLTTYARVQRELANEDEVDRSQLPDWLQTAIVLGKDKDGKIIYLQVQPPQQTLLQFVGAAQKEGALGVSKELTRQLSPVWKSLMIARGYNPSGGPAPETTKEALSLIAQQFVPTWEIAGMLQVPYANDKPRTTTPLPEGVGALMSPIGTYDLPYAQAKEKIQAESALDDYLKKVRQGIDTEKIEVPETSDVEREVEKLDKAAMAKEVINELSNNPWKNSLLDILSKDSGKRKWDMINEHPELFYGSNEEVANRLRKVLTPENLLRLVVYLGRPVRPADIVEHYTALERGEIPAIPPQVRTIQKIMEQIRTMQKGEQTGGVLNPPTDTSVNKRFNRPLTENELVAVLQEAMHVTGVSQDWLGYLLWLVKVENAQFNPYATNPQAVNGEHATGLMQMLPSTFRTYAAPGMNDIFNPLHNMVAAIRYIQARYGHPSRIPGIGRKPWRGY